MPMPMEMESEHPRARGRARARLMVIDDRAWDRPAARCNLGYVSCGVTGWLLEARDGNWGEAWPGGLEGRRDDP